MESKQHEIRVSAPLALAGTFNTRDLGGYRTADGHTTKTGRFLRSDAPDRLPPASCAALYDYGVRCVVDLRTPAEAEAAPSALRSYRDIAYHNVPFLDHVNSETAGKAAAGPVSRFPDSMGEVYRGILQNNPEALVKALRIILEAEGCVLYNCAAGKDRTGVLSMLLLGNAGVPEEIIVADYAVSEVNLAPSTEAFAARMKEAGVELPPHVLGSDAENMRTTLDFIRGGWGDIPAYLRWCGLGAQEIAALRSRLAG